MIKIYKYVKDVIRRKEKIRWIWKIINEFKLVINTGSSKTKRKILFIEEKVSVYTVALSISLYLYPGIFAAHSQRKKNNPPQKKTQNSK